MTYYNPFLQAPPQSLVTPGQQLPKVNGMESAKAYPTAPNSTVALFDANDDVMYVKSTDASNFPTIRRFRFYEESEQKVEESKYVTIEEFNKFKEEVLNAQQFVWKSTASADTTYEPKHADSATK